MRRTIADIRDNIDYVGCDNATALEMCNEIQRLQGLYDAALAGIQHRDGMIATIGDEIERLQSILDLARPEAGYGQVWDDYCETVPIVVEFCRAGSLANRVRAMAEDRKRLQQIEAEYNDCRDYVARMAQERGAVYEEQREEIDRLQAIVGRLPILVELSAIDAIRNFIQHGHEMSERDCYPSLYKRGEKWRYHRRIAANDWDDNADPITAAENARKT